MLAKRAGDANKFYRGTKEAYIERSCRPIFHILKKSNKFLTYLEFYTVKMTFLYWNNLGVLDMYNISMKYMPHITKKYQLCMFTDVVV